ncbi:hypothetical protein [Mycobacterium sp. SP-6446]|uniref:hypothetical protein n=1 Tax=Mycobacterium sp. SP-6446 TaxID=1834162 RepID=UPI00096FF407|nr:hypothetical protein [Mycobacterium sp. SP-6446]OMC08444.1 hypothetical protein A5736_06585 [Mycobacterium sp. SP-6446]
MTTPTNPDPSAGDLSTLMQQLGQSGDVSDMRLSESARQAYTGALTDYQNTLSALRDKAAGLVDYGAVGDPTKLWSANETRGNQIDNAAILAAGLDDLIKLVANTVDAWNAGFNRMIAEDKAS